ncbi:MAG: hypothetical protein M3P27_12840 [Acidobacteriota bacterium]|nr:hypothetical protein [Acidobacteriota bacterium]
MNCAEFQKSLPEIVDGAGNAEQHAHGQTCPVCSDLVQDLKYIAEQAKLLVPMHDPSPRVWLGIQGSLEREGMVRPSAGRFQPQVMAGGGARWGTYARWGAVAAIALIAIGLIAYNNRGTESPANSTTATNANAPASGDAADANDAKLVAAVAQDTPERAEVYKRSMQDVNAYIADAQKSVDQDPSDDAAHEHLLSAYDQKAMLYAMATSGPME